ncbi:MAG: DEAD/DEAH box helicase [Ignavibacteriales bacterium]|jgi:ATP-dependent RNA helicase RhlE|nr:MAG: DEAD/DEAH box helicase [Ignavibacteriales bacterium]
MTFEQLGIISPILKAVAYEGYTEPSPIQEQAIPVLLKGHDMLASAQTGTGKTAAFAIPIIQALYQKRTEEHTKREIKALVLAPTRELAEQIKESFRNYSRDLHIKAEVIYGGVSQKNQEVALKKGLDVLIATPGRLLDLMNQKLVFLDTIEYFVLDEADRMLDMGFINDVRKIVSTIPKERQTMLFSATIPNEILKLANDLLKDPVRIEVTPPEAMIDKIKQSLYYVPKKDKFKLLLDLLVNPKLVSVLVFTRTKHGANKLVKELIAYGVKADAIHGNKSQNKRQQALLDFKNRKLRVLVATDIAARGIDIDELSHVINFDLPETPETYVHRMGRTGRAGLSGEAYSFCSHDEMNLLKAIEKLIQMPIPLVTEQPFHVVIKDNGNKQEQPKKKQEKPFREQPQGSRTKPLSQQPKASRTKPSPSTSEKKPMDLNRFTKDYVSTNPSKKQEKLGPKKEETNKSSQKPNSPKSKKTSDKFYDFKKNSNSKYDRKR